MAQNVYLTVFYVTAAVHLGKDNCMKRVVIFAAAAATIVQFTKYNMTALQTLGCEIHVVCNLQKSNLSDEARFQFDRKFPKLIWHDIAFEENIGALRKNQQAMLVLENLLREIQPDLLECHGTIAAQYGRRAATSLQIPVFYIAHDFRIFRRCLLTERLYFSLIERKLARNTTYFFAVCPEDAIYAEKHLHQKHVVSWADVGLDCERFATPKRTRTQVLNELHIPENAIVLISVGTLRMQKRLRVVLQAMARLRHQREELPLHYLICGEGPEMLFLQKLIEKLRLSEQVHLLGYRMDIPDLLGASDIFCMPSRREGCGMAALEAMAAGLPLITVRSHGTKTYAEHKESAYCLKGDLVIACAKAITQLCDNKLLRRQMGAHNRVLAKRFSDEGRMMEIRQYYQKILGDAD